MKTKILITSILLAVFGTILVGYLLVGCSLSRQEGTSKQTEDQSNEGVTWSDVRQPTDAESQSRPIQTLPLKSGEAKSEFSEFRTEVDEIQSLDFCF